MNFMLEPNPPAGYTLDMSQKLLLSSLCALLVASCTHEYKDIKISTIPEGATIRINGEEKENKTPFTTSVYQRGNVAIVAEKQGYVTATRNIIPETDKFLSVVWTSDDERTRFIPEEEVHITLKKIESSKNYKASDLPNFNPPYKPTTVQPTRTQEEQSAPALRPMPQF